MLTYDINIKCAHNTNITIVMVEVMDAKPSTLYQALISFDIINNIVNLNYNTFSASHFLLFSETAWNKHI